MWKFLYYTSFNNKIWLLVHKDRSKKIFFSINYSLLRKKTMKGGGLWFLSPFGWNFPFFPLILAASTTSSLKSPPGITSAAGAAGGASSAAPLRVRFARAENDLQRRRREQSAFYKQKLVEQDQWIPLRVEHKVGFFFAWK